MATSKNKHFLFRFVDHYTLSTANVFDARNISILNIDDYCLKVTPRDNSLVEKDRYLYGFV